MKIPKEHVGTNPPELCSRESIDGSTYDIVRWPNLASYLDSALALPRHPANDEHRSATKYDPRSREDFDDETKDFVSEQSPQACVSRVTYPEAHERLGKLLSECNVSLAPAPARRMRRVWDEFDGDEYDRDRALACDDPWRRMKRVRRISSSRQFVRITVNISADCGQTADSLLWSGASACRLADQLEDRGYRVQVEAISYVSGIMRDGDRLHCGGDTWIVKRYAEPLDIDTILLGTAWPSLLRFHQFCSHLRRPYRIRDAHAWPIYETPKALQGDIHLEKAFSAMEADRQVSAALVRYGVTL